MDGRATAWIDVVIARAAELRRAGVLSIGCDGYTAMLAPHVEPLQPATATSFQPDPDHIGDPFHDPASYPSGVVPGFDIEKFVVLED